MVIQGSATLVPFGAIVLYRKGHKVKVQIWDAGGKEEFRSLIRPAYYQKANAILIVYDITNQASFESVEHDDRYSACEMSKVLFLLHRLHTWSNSNTI